MKRNQQKAMYAKVKLTRIHNPKVFGYETIRNEPSEFRRYRRLGFKVSKVK